MTELKEELDRALRAMPVGEAPVRRAMRAGRRLRNRRRLAVLAGALAVAAVAAVSPTLARGGAAPALPATSHPATPVPSATGSPHRDPVVTGQPPGPDAAAGTIAQGRIDGLSWTVVLGPTELNAQGGQAGICFTAFTALAAAGPASRPTAQLTSGCALTAAELVSYAGSGPAGFTGGIGSAGGAGTPEQVLLGAAAPDVAYFVLDFTDGQQLKLIPVSYQGRRYVAWVAPAAMTIAGLTAHRGGPNADNGQLTTAVPYDPPGEFPVFGLWHTSGQAVPPRASGVIGHAVLEGLTWSATAYEGPWGTCFVPSPSGGAECVDTGRLATTALLGDSAGNPVAPTFGSAAPGVARLRISLSNGKAVQVTPVSVGNERLFAFWPDGASPTGWTAYDAAGRVLGGGATVAGAPSGTATPG